MTVDPVQASSVLLLMQREYTAIKIVVFPLHININYVKPLCWSAPFLSRHLISPGRYLKDFPPTVSLFPAFALLAYFIITLVGMLPVAQFEKGLNSPPFHGCYTSRLHANAR